jgi:hypothetical protein
MVELNYFILPRKVFPFQSQCLRSTREVELDLLFLKCLLPTERERNIAILDDVPSLMMVPLASIVLRHLVELLLSLSLSPFTSSPLCLTAGTCTGKTQLQRKPSICKQNQKAKNFFYKFQT